MNRVTKQLSRPFTALAVLLVLASGAMAAGAKHKKKLKFGTKTEVVLTPGLVTAGLVAGQKVDEPFDAKKSKQARGKRGDETVFAGLAPSVVVVRTNSGHGTGFLISADGLVLTNNHVIAHGMTYDPALHASVAQIHLGKLAPDGTMALLPQATPAVFYKTDVGKDLALLKLTSIPPELGKTVPFVRFADQGPHPAEGCSMVGHPGSGMLWSYRSCKVSAVGRSTDIVRVLMLRLAGLTDREADVQAALDDLPARRTVLSSCGASPGDSGGPLVDEKGNLIAVTFAIPQEGKFDKFTYHVHLDEVREFLAQPPTQPTVLTPDAWALGPEVELSDVLGEGTKQTLLAGAGRPQQLLVDLDGDTKPGLSSRELVTKRAFDAEFAVHMGGDGAPVAFYDTDNKGRFDLIVESGGDGDETSDRRVYKLGDDGKWEVREARDDEKWLSPAYLADEKLAAKLSQILKRLSLP